MILISLYNKCRKTEVEHETSLIMYLSMDWEHRGNRRCSFVSLAYVFYGREWMAMVVDRPCGRADALDFVGCSGAFDSFRGLGAPNANEVLGTGKINGLTIAHAEHTRCPSIPKRAEILRLCLF